VRKRFIYAPENDHTLRVYLSVSSRQKQGVAVLYKNGTCHIKLPLRGDFPYGVLAHEALHCAIHMRKRSKKIPPCGVTYVQSKLPRSEWAEETLCYLVQRITDAGIAAYEQWQAEQVFTLS
jgi:hypothetical protein